MCDNCVVPEWKSTGEGSALTPRAPNKPNLPEQFTATFNFSVKNPSGGGFAPVYNPGSVMYYDAAYSRQRVEFKYVATGGFPMNLTQCTFANSSNILINEVRDTRRAERTELKAPSLVSYSLRDHSTGFLLNLPKLSTGLARGISSHTLPYWVTPTKHKYYTRGKNRVYQSC